MCREIWENMCRWIFALVCLEKTDWDTATKMLTSSNENLRAFCLFVRAICPFSHHLPSDLLLACIYLPLVRLNGSPLSYNSHTAELVNLVGTAHYTQVGLGCLIKEASFCFFQFTPTVLHFQVSRLVINPFKTNLLCWLNQKQRNESGVIHFFNDIKKLSHNSHNHNL